MVGGDLGYHFADMLALYAGVGPLPSTRSTNYTFPSWLKVDHRTIADEYFRGSFTTGIWASGALAPGFEYRVMLGNNLSQLGVDASQLDDGMNTVSAALWWMPTTGEFGAQQGFGDYEGHDELATLFGVHFTHSREDAQSQPGVDGFENAQIRLSDGTLLFEPDAFETDAQITKATYLMGDANAGWKYRGFSLEAEYYLRWVNNLETTGPIPVDSLFDHGFQAQASAMLVARVLQLYAAGSQIFGQYGDPRDLSFGLNWFPFARRELRLNVQALYLDRSPVGYAAVPFIVGGDGWVFSADTMLSF